MRTYKSRYGGFSLNRSLVNFLYMRQNIFLLLFVTLSFPAFSGNQINIQKDRRAMRYIEKGLNATYNFEFDLANDYADSLDAYLGEHPTVYLLKARVLFWKQKFVPDANKLETQYVHLLERGMELTLELLAKYPESAEAKFAALTFNGMFAEYWFDEGSSMKAINYGKVLYNYVKEGFGLMDQFPDFYFTTGLYNFYRVKFPQNNPIYRPFMMFFKSGDIELGLEQMAYATENGVFTAVEARQYLFHLQLRYGMDAKSALQQSRYLITHFPNNPYFRCMYLENLAYLEKEDGQRMEMARALTQQNILLYKAPAYTFMARFLSEDNPKDPQVKTYLLEAEKYFLKQEHPSDHGLCVTYIELAKYAEATGNSADFSKYKKLAIKYNKYDIDSRSINAL
ncbi:hypothetical protein PEDI_03780 [Persicobacter diffluens]|uniref:Tetratricopeptide repeat protein n=2 Tax=Persicobacter diffluens TaxID=981 RepID=A0AAN4VTR3_9BACT|nr:hypothetical protein PEDI_03780 [Persicobacter diffluens]